MPEFYQLIVFRKQGKAKSSQGMLLTATRYHLSGPRDSGNLALTASKS